MAENITGIDNSSWGGRLSMIFPFSSRSMESGFFPKKTLVSIGSLKGSMDGFVTWLALMTILSQYTG